MIGPSCHYDVIDFVFVAKRRGRAAWQQIQNQCPGPRKKARVRKKAGLGMRSTQILREQKCAHDQPGLRKKSVLGNMSLRDTTSHSCDGFEEHGFGKP